MQLVSTDMRAAAAANELAGLGTRVWHPAREFPFRGSGPVPALLVADEQSAEIDLDLEPADLPYGMQLPGSRLRILDRLNDGGCGVVYRGEHIDLQRPLAIKVLRCEMAGVGARDLFLDEARTTTRIESPHVVHVVDFGELPDGRVWYAMELLGGLALDQLVATGGRMTAARAIALLRMACKGLGAAHEAGVVHRDVKPQNLVVIERGGLEHLVLVDFGIALPAGTRPAGVSGTPEYMSREQIMCGVLDARTDVYGLGCCAFELLTGNSLVGSCTVSEAMLKHNRGIEPDFPREAAVPLALQEVVRRCLEVDPARRYSSMAELEAALCEAQIAAGIAQGCHDLALPAVEPARRQRIADGFAALTHRRRRPRARAAFLWSTIAAAMITAVAAWPQEQVAKAASRANKVLAAGPFVPDVPVIPAPVTTSMGPMPSLPPAGPREPVVAAAIAEVASPAEPASSEPPPSSPTTKRAEIARADLVRELNGEGQRALRRGDRTVAELAFRRALDVDARSSNAVAGLADVHFERGEHDRALHFAKLAVQRAPQSHSHRIRLGDSYYRLARTDEARAEYLEAESRGSLVAGRRLAALDRRGS